MLLQNGINYQTTFSFSGGRAAGKLILAPKKTACGLFQTTFSAAGLWTVFAKDLLSLCPGGCFPFSDRFCLRSFQFFIEGDFLDSCPAWPDLQKPSYHDQGYIFYNLTQIIKVISWNKVRLLFFFMQQELTLRVFHQPRPLCAMCLQISAALRPELAGEQELTFYSAFLNKDTQSAHTRANTGLWDRADVNC